MESHVDCTTTVPRDSSVKRCGDVARCVYVTVWNTADGGVLSNDAPDDAAYDGGVESGNNTPAAKARQHVGARKMVVGSAALSSHGHDDDADANMMDDQGRRVKRVLGRDGVWRLVVVGAAGMTGSRDDDDDGGSGMTISHPGDSCGRHLLASKRVAGDYTPSQQRNTDSEHDNGTDRGAASQRAAIAKMQGHRVVHATDDHGMDCRTAMSSPVTDADVNGSPNSGSGDHRDDTAGMWSPARANVRPRVIVGADMSESLSRSGSFYDDGEEWRSMVDDGQPTRRRVLGKDGKWTLVVVGGSVMSQSRDDDDDEDAASSRPSSRATGHVVTSRAGPGARQVSEVAC